MEIKHPLKFNQLYPIQTVLMDLASQENCDGEPYDQMMEASEYISELEKKLEEIAEIVDNHEQCAIASLWDIKYVCER